MQRKMQGGGLSSAPCREHSPPSNTQMTGPKLGTVWCTLSAQTENIKSSSKVKFVPASRGTRSCCSPDWRRRVTSHRPIHHPASPSPVLPAPPALLYYSKSVGSLLAGQPGTAVRSSSERSGTGKPARHEQSWLGGR